MASDDGQPQVGQEVEVAVGDQRHRGTVFCCDPALDVLVLEEPHPQSTLKQDVRFLKLSKVDDITVVAQAPDGPPRELPNIPDALLRKREQEGLRRAQRDLQKIGKGVTPATQLLFDTLDKTYSLKWRDQDMVTELGIVIKPPYTPDCCSGRDEAALERIKTVVATIQRRIEAGELKP